MEKLKKTWILTCALLLLQLTTFASVSPSCAMIHTGPLDVEADVGSMHFRGEIADFYIVSLSSTPIEDIRLKVTIIQGDVSTKSTALSDLTDTVADIQEDIVTIKTDIGEIKATLRDMQNRGGENAGATSLWLVLAVIATIVAVTAIMLFLKEHGKSKVA